MILVEFQKGRSLKNLFSAGNNIECKTLENVECRTLLSRSVEAICDMANFECSVQCPLSLNYCITN